MVKLVVTKIGSKKRKHKRRAVAKRRVRDLDGQFMTQFWVDSNSHTFDDDLTSVFKGNVARVRLANQRAFGSPDGFQKAAGKVSEKFVRMLRSIGSSDAIQKK